MKEEAKPKYGKNVTIILIIICAVVVAFSAYQLISYFAANKAAEDAFEGLIEADADIDVSADSALSYEQMLPYYEDLRAKNGDMVGWIRIPKMNISYPVMQTPNSPQYYIDRDFEEQYSASGSIFASELSDVDLPTDIVTLYGHRMKTGTMFGNLGKLLDAEYLQEHDTVIFDTFTGRNVYKIYCLFSLDVGTGDPNEFSYHTYNNFADEEMFSEFMRRVREHAEAENPSYAPVYGDKLLQLSTCEYTHENGRLVLIAVRVNA